MELEQVVEWFSGIQRAHYRAVFDKAVDDIERLPVDADVKQMLVEDLRARLDADFERCVAEMSAPGSTAPLWSVTRPLISAVVCANKLMQLKAEKRKPTNK